MIKKIIPAKLKKQLRNFFSLAKEYGQYNSIKENNALDKSGREIPWYTYPTIEYLNHLDFSTKDIFEWGAGNSSVYWSKLARSVVSIEYNEEWFNLVSKVVGGNQEIKLLLDKDEYINSISLAHKKFDVIIIDDQFREECLDIAPHFLNTNGFIILDNSDRFPEKIFQNFRARGFTQVDFHGFGPINAYTWTTTLFFSKSFNFDYRSSLRSIASIE
jgi:hypothetical protein